MYLEYLGRKIEYQIKTCKKSRKVRVMFKVKTGVLMTVTKPTYVNITDTIECLESDKERIFKLYDKFLEQNLDRINPKMEDGMAIYLFGKEYKLKINYDKNSSKENVAKRKNDKKTSMNFKFDEENSLAIFTIRQEEGNLDLANSKIEEAFKKLLKKTYKSILEEYLKDRMLYFEELFDSYITKVSVKYMASRFGSCNSKRRRINFSSRIAMFSKEEIDAVIAHEMCHIKEANHKEGFYKLLLENMPNYYELSKALNKDSRKMMYI